MRFVEPHDRQRKTQLVILIQLRFQCDIMPADYRSDHILRRGFPNTARHGNFKQRIAAFPKNSGRNTSHGDRRIIRFHNGSGIAVIQITDRERRGGSRSKSLIDIKMSVCALAFQCNEKAIRLELSRIDRGAPHRDLLIAADRSACKFSDFFQCQLHDFYDPLK